MSDPMQNESWILPDGIEEVLPPEAALVERRRRQLLDLFASWGYDYVIPPFVEFLDALLTGTGSDLDLQTFKLTDQLSGRTLGIRADITPQAARMDAHNIGRDEPTRLCYLGSVLHTRSDGFAGSRSPLQIGAELYGHAGVESDVEILRLMMQTLELTGLEEVYLDLGHVGIYRGLAQQAGLSESQERALFDALQRKALPEVAELLADFQVDAEVAAMLAALGELNGDVTLLSRARHLLKAADQSVQQALDYLQRMADQIAIWLPQLPIHFDLAELRGYHFHTGVVFAAFVPGSGREIARGGRYDRIGKVFGRARPATGFSTDLKTLIRLGNSADVPQPEAIFAPWSDDPALAAEVERLRVAGQRVISGLPGQQGGAQEMGCIQELRLSDGQWRLVRL
ncbi:ATP phosphoribosyltransferase regulatory subunit [Candidatus Endoriftia persephone]|jgi:ATP phosphoribosyltransferase regulatory subunit|nr:ATP phosphoribosyltransferase regulatory subunit [Candidatus Endoriftia persephone]USF86484.1 ATP phosphoribosyltransferase regulatory subunit [Candidatus Endoriftia persephone]